MQSWKYHKEVATTSEYNYSWLSLSRTRKGPENLFEIERVRDRERKIGYSLHKGTETLVRDRERFEIEGVRDRESQLYFILYRNYICFTTIAPGVCICKSAMRVWNTVCRLIASYTSRIKAAYEKRWKFNIYLPIHLSDMTHLKLLLKEFDYCSQNIYLL